MDNRDKRIAEAANSDRFTKDLLYNKGLELLRVNKFSEICTNKAAKYYVVCNNL